MMFLSRNRKIAQFKLQFEHLLPRSFDDIFLYVNKKYRKVKLPVYRTTAQRHIFLAEIFFMTNQAPELKTLISRYDKANDKFDKNEFIATLVAPFDHIEDSQELLKKLESFCRDLENLSDEAFNNLYQFLYNSFIRIVLDDIKWWLRKSFPPILLKIMTILTGLIFFCQSICKMRIIARTLTFSILNNPVSISLISLFYIFSILLIFILSIKGGGFWRFIFSMLAILFLPVVAILRLLAKLSMHIFDIAYEHLTIIDKKYRLNNIFSNAIFIISVLPFYFANIICLILFNNKILLIINIALTIIVQFILLFWFYFWNFQPLFFLRIGLQIYFALRFINLQKNQRDIAKLTSQAIEEHISDLRLSANFCRRIESLLNGTRFNVFSANSFVILFLSYIFIFIFQYACIYYAFYKINPDHFYFITQYSKTLYDLNIYDFFGLALNNLPIGGLVKISSDLFIIELLLFAERISITYILAISIFAFSYFSDDQLDYAKNNIRMVINDKLQIIKKLQEAYNSVSGNAKNNDSAEFFGTDERT